MVVAVVQKCGRESRSKGRDPPTNLGFYLHEFLGFFGDTFNYGTTGITLLGEGGGFLFNKRETEWFTPKKSRFLCLQSPIDPSVDVGANSFKIGAEKANMAKRSKKRPPPPQSARDSPPAKTRRSVECQRNPLQKDPAGEGVPKMHLPSAPC